MSNAEAVAEALQMLGSAYRGDWADFDGRSLRSQLNELAAALKSDKPFDVEVWAVISCICPVNRQWAEHCSDRSGITDWEECRHTMDIRDRRSEDEVL